MEIRKHHLALAHAGPLGLDRLFDFDDHLGLRPDVAGFGDERATRVAICVVPEARAKARPLLDQHRVSVAHERLYARRHEGHAILGCFDFLRDADDHVRSVIVYAPSGPNHNTVCRSGAKNSAATAPTSSSVSSPTAAST